MSAQQPGFGIAPTVWDGFIFAGLTLVGAIAAASAGHPVWTGVLLLLCIGSWIGGRTDLANVRAEQTALATQPPTPQAELTRHALRWFGATLQDLEINRQNLISEAQWRRIAATPAHQRLKLKAQSPVSHVQGPVRLAYYKPNRGRGYYEVKIQGAAFRDDREGFVRAFKRMGHYRIYFVELAYISWGFTCRPILFPLSAEGLGNA